MERHKIAVRAAILWLYPNITQHELEIEIAWAMREIRINKNGNLIWRLFPLGRKLFTSLSEAQNWRCCYCHAPTTKFGRKRATIEHVVRLVDGGLDHPDNMLMACYECNRDMGTLLEWGSLKVR